MTTTTTLFQFPPALGLPISESPPCAKVEAYFRLTKTPFVLALGDTRRSPNRMVPFVRWPDGNLQAESGDIIAKLERQIGLDDNADADSMDSARALAEQIEEICYDACLYDRFVGTDGWRYQEPITRRLLGNFVPSILATPAVWFIRRQQIRRATRGVMAEPQHGYKLAQRLVAQVDSIVARRVYLCGDDPSTVDCAIWANLLHLGATPNPSPARDAVRQSKHVCAYLFRFADRIGVVLPPQWLGE